MHIKHVLVGLGALLLAQVGGLAFAAPPPNITQTVGVCDPWFPTRCTQAGPFVPDASSSATLAVTTASARVALPGSGLTVVVTNNGTSDFYVKLGSSTVTAATTDFFVGAGRQAVLARGTATYIAAITDAGTSTLVAQTGSGTPATSGGGGGGSTGSGVKATAAAPTYVEGSTGNPVSTDLHGSQRALILDSTGSAVDFSATTPTYLVDTGGTTKASVKAASTAPATTDTSLVVALSPNPSPVCSSTKAISQTASTDLITSTGKLYICSIILNSASAQSFSLVEGTGSVCGTGTAALIGATTSSLAVAANGGFSAVSFRPWIQTQTTADHLCLLQSGAGNISGVITYKDF